MTREGDVGKIEFVVPSEVTELVDVGKQGGGTGRAKGEDMEFIPNMIRSKRASAGRIGDMLIGGTEVPVSRKGFTLGT